MFCKNCGTKLNDGDNVCANCGRLNEKTVESRKFGKKIIFILSGAVVLITVAIIGITALINNMSYTTIDFSKLYQVTFDGLNKDGKGTITLNEQELALISERVLKEGDSTETNALMLLQTIPYTLTPNESLSNGDEVILKIAFTEDAFKQIKLKAVNTQQTIKVKGLVEPREVDVFEGLQIEFSGRSPFITGTVITGNCPDFAKNYVEFSTDKQHYADGETVKILASYDKSDCEKQAVSVLQDEKEYVAESKEAYLDSVDGVNLTDLHKALYKQLRLEENAADTEFIGVTLVQSSVRDRYDGTKSENELGDAFIALREKDEFSSREIYNSYALHTQCDVSVIVEPDTSRERYEILRIDVVLIANNLFTNENGILQWDDLIDTMAEESNAGNLKSLFIKENQGAFNLISSNDSKVTSIETQNTTSNSDSGGATDTQVKTAAVSSITTGNADYILPDSATRILADSEVKSLSSNELMFARNEIYARHGRKFDDAELKAYFESKTWYNGTVEAADFSDIVLSDIEKSNITLIVQYE